MKDIVTQLIEVLGKEAVLTHEEAAMRSAGVWGKPRNLDVLALVRPQNTEEVAKVLRLCHEARQPVVPHGGLSNVVGSAVTAPHEIALSLERMNRIEEIDEINKTVTVQAGVVLQDLQQAVAEQGFLFPLDLGAKGSCTIGGNVSTNAGGLQALRYGVTRQLVLGLEAVLADGTVLSSLHKLQKNNTGYDLKHLFIGTEGTLGVVTKVVLKLEDAPKSRNTAFIALESFEATAHLLRFAKEKLAGTLTTFELFWEEYYRLMTSPPSGFTPPLPHGSPFYVLIEALGQNPEKDQQLFEAMLEEALLKGDIVDAVMAHSQHQLDWFWGIREKVEYAAQYHGWVVAFDVSLAISDMDAYIRHIKAQLSHQWPEYYFYAFGHMGDGNLHLYVYVDDDYESTRQQIEEIVYRPLQAINGSVSAEHGIGLYKKQWLALSRTPQEIQLMKMLKRALDPRSILNPGKIF